MVNKWIQIERLSRYTSGSNSIKVVIPVVRNSVTWVKKENSIQPNASNVYKATNTATQSATVNA